MINAIGHDDDHAGGFRECRDGVCDGIDGLPAFGGVGAR